MTFEWFMIGKFIKIIYLLIETKMDFGQNEANVY